MSHFKRSLWYNQDYATMSACVILLGPSLGEQDIENPCSFDDHEKYSE